MRKGGGEGELCRKTVRRASIEFVKAAEGEEGWRRVWKTLHYIELDWIVRLGVFQLSIRVSKKLKTRTAPFTLSPAFKHFSCMVTAGYVFPAYQLGFPNFHPHSLLKKKTTFEVRLNYPQKTGPIVGLLRQILC